MNYRLENYPDDEKSLYYVEFSQLTKESKLKYRLFKRHWEDFAKNELNPTGELHPWNLADGEVNIFPNAIRMDTEKFLKFMVDALNEKVNNYGGK